MSDCQITVAVRCRPVSESMQGSTPVVYKEKSIIVKGYSFKFDHIFPYSSNEEVYESTVSPNIGDLFKGINVTVLAYGATGSGKTYTMGTEYDASKGDTEAGIIHRSIQDIFTRISNEEDPSSYSVKISFIEVYGEDVYDLLQPGSKPITNIRQDHEGFKIPNVLKLPATSSEEILAALKRGCAERKTSPTARNLKSSRSHGIFTVFIEQRDDESLIKRSKFLLVDLAGSERLDSTGLNTAKEGIGINKGLLSLRQVIKSLAKHSHHAPFRDSKLTKILQDSLEGSQAIMVACIYPTADNIDETLNTLRYASLANSVVIKTKTFVSSDIEIANLKKQVSELQAALKIRKLSGGDPAAETRDVATATSPLENSDLFYYKYINAQNAMSKLQENYETKYNFLRNIYEQLKTLKTVLENEVDSTQYRQQELSKILDDVLKSYVDVVVIESTKGVESSDEETIKALSDSDECAMLSEKLDEIAEIMSSNADTVKNLEDLAQSGEGVDQDVVAQLVRKIEELTEEKDRLQEIVAANVDGKVNTDRKRIDCLVEEISNLKADLKEKKQALRQREAQLNEIKRLKNENDNLKHLKVDLMRKIKEAGTKYVHLNSDKNKEITQLQKTNRKMQVEQNKTISKLGKEISVLQQKLNTVTRKCNSLGMKKNQVSRSNISSKSLEARIKDSLENIINKKTAEILTKKTEEEVKSVLPNLEQYETDAESNFSAEEKEKIQEKIAAAKFYVGTVMAKTSGEIKDQKTNISDTIKNVLNSVTSLVDAKQGISLLFREFLCIYERMFLENDDQSCKFQEQIKKLEEQLKAEQKSCNDQVCQVIQEKRAAEEINIKLLEQLESLSVQLESVKNLEGDAQMIEKLKLQESIIIELRSSLESYKKKDAEIQTLSKDLFRAKNGKTTPWLGRVPLRIKSQEESQTLMEEFLDESLEESFMDDKSDPDWRATPLHKQRIKERLARKCPESEDDDSPPAKKSTLVGGCSCSGGCKTMRCRCRKSKIDCSNECGCKTKCFNCPKSNEDSEVKIVHED